MLTERDREIIMLIHRFGYLTADHVARAFRMSKRMVYRRLQVLVRERFLRHRRFLAGRPGLYWATPAGRDAAGTELPRFTIRLSTMPHHLLVADVALALSAKTGGTWIREPIDQLEVDLPPLPKPEAMPNHQNWLFDSRRDYFTRLVAYKAYRGGITGTTTETSG